MSMDEAPRAIFIGGPEDQYPPWSDAQRDAQIEALRYAFCSLVQELNMTDKLHGDNFAVELEGGSMVFFQDKPDTAQALNQLAYLLRPPGAAR